MESGTVVSRHATRPCRENSRRPVRDVATPVATAPSQTMSRLQPRVATNWEILLRPDVGEGHNMMLRGGWCASLVSESVHSRLGLSSVIEEQSE